MVVTGGGLGWLLGFAMVVDAVTMGLHGVEDTKKAALGGTRR